MHDDVSIWWLLLKNGIHHLDYYCVPSISYKYPSITRGYKLPMSKLWLAMWLCESMTLSYKQAWHDPFCSVDNPCSISWVLKKYARCRYGPHHVQLFGFTLLDVHYLVPFGQCLLGTTQDLWGQMIVCVGECVNSSCVWLLFLGIDHLHDPDPVFNRWPRECGLQGEGVLALGELGGATQVWLDWIRLAVAPFSPIAMDLSRLDY